MMADLKSMNEHVASAENVSKRERVPEAAFFINMHREIEGADPFYFSSIEENLPFYFSSIEENNYGICVVALAVWCHHRNNCD